MALGIFDYIFGENRFKQGDSGSDPTDYGLLNQTTQPDYLKQGVDYMAKGVGNLYDTAKDVQLLGGISDLGRVAENYQRRFRGQEVIPPTEPEFITNYRNRVENIPRPKYDTEKGGFQGILGGEEGADRFIGENVLGMLELANRPVEMGEMLSNVAVGGIGNLTGTDIDPYYQEIASEMGKEIAGDFDSWDAFNKSLMESPDTPAMVLGGATYGGLKMLQLYKTNPKFQNAIRESFENAKNPGLSIKDISARKQGEITAPIDEYGFYDPIEQLLMDLPQEVNTPSDIKRYLMKRGIKREQIAESKIDDYLQGKDRVTKEGLLNQINAEKTALVETTLMGDGYDADFDRLSLDNPDIEFEPYRVGGAEILRSREDLRNPSDRNWEAINDTDYIDSVAEDYKYQWSGRTLDDLVETDFTSNDLVFKLNKIDSEKYPLTVEQKRKLTEMQDLRGSNSDSPELNPKWYDKIKDQEPTPDVLDELALDMAEDQYWQSPFYEWRVKTPDGDEYKVVGNDELGLTITNPWGRKINEDPLYSLDEAEIQINDDAMEQGLLSLQSDGGTVYSNYTGDADLDMDTYEEVLITAPNLPEDYFGDHFEGYLNNIAHLRMADTPDGKRKKVIEIQSDLHQKGRQHNYDTKEFRKKNAEDRKKLPELEKQQQKDFDAYNQAQDEFFRNTTILSELAEEKGFKVDYDVQFDPNAKDLRGMTISRGNLYLHFLDGKLNRIHTGKGTTLTQSRQFGSMPGLDPSQSPFKGDWKLSSPDDLPPIKDEWKPIFETIKEDNKLYNTREEILERRNRLNNQIENIKYPTTVPDAPLKDERWVQNAVERAINKARQEGKEGVEFVDSEYSLDIWNPRRTKENGKVRYQELYQNVYDKKVPSVLKTYKNKYGGEVEKLEGGGYYYKFDDKSRDVKGIPLASIGGLLSIDQMQDDDKMNNKQGLLA